MDNTPQDKINKVQGDEGVETEPESVREDVEELSDDNLDAASGGISVSTSKDKAVQRVLK